MKKLIVALSLLFIPLLASASIDTNLYYGLKANSDVKELQEFLIDKGFLTGSATGNFYSLTLSGVKKYQASVGINQTGYVGVLTRKAINDELAANLSDSNKEATDETGTTPPVTEAPKTISDLQAQIALLQQQLSTLNTQTQSIAQNTQQIAQNTTPSTPATPVPSTPTNNSVSSAPVSQKDLQITSVTDSYNCLVFSATVIGDDGKALSVKNQISMTVDKEPGLTSLLSMNNGQMKTTYCPEKLGETNMTFSYPPLDLVKTVTVNVLVPYKN